MKPTTKVEGVRLSSNGANRWGVMVDGNLVARGQCRTMKRRARGIIYGIMDHKGRCVMRKTWDPSTSSNIGDTGGAA